MMQFNYATQQQRVERMLELYNSTDEKEQQEFYALFLGIVQDLVLKEDEWIIDVGNYANVNAEFLIRLKDKHKELHKIFWRFK